MGKNPIENLRVAAPCLVSWASMAGDERVRHCTLCSLNVYNFAEMTRDEVGELLARTEGRVCGRLYRRADGTVLTRDCPSGLRALRRRASRAAAALIAALLSFPSLAFAGTPWEKKGSSVKVETQQAASAQTAIFDGVVREESANALPGVAVTVRDEASNQQRTVVITDKNGAFNIPALNEGLYRIEVALSGFKPATIEHVHLKASVVTHASVTLQSDFGVTMGVIVFESVATSDSNTTTVTQEFMRKMPF